MLKRNLQQPFIERNALGNTDNDEEDMEIPSGEGRRGVDQEDMVSPNRAEEIRILGRASEAKDFGLLSLHTYEKTIEKNALIEFSHNLNYDLSHWDAYHPSVSLFVQIII